MIAALVVAAALTAHAPATVPIDDWFPVHGHAVVAGAPRTLLLEQRTGPGEWHRLAKEPTRRTGWFRFSVPSGNRLTERTLRVVAPPSRGLPRAHTAPFTVDIVMRDVTGGRI
ncbi:hypothetical protein [Nocardioides sp. HB32]